jgi:hypothetical protein
VKVEAICESRGGSRLSVLHTVGGSARYVDTDASELLSGRRALHGLRSDMHSQDPLSVPGATRSERSGQPLPPGFLP